MDLVEFDALAESLRQESATSMAKYGFPLIEGHTATADEVASVEKQMGVTLPAKYKTFMTRYGGGMFGFVESIRTLVLRLVWENPQWGYRRATGPRGEGRALHRLGDPEGRRDRPGTRTRSQYMGGLPALPGRHPAGL